MTNSSNAVEREFEVCCEFFRRFNIATKNYDPPEIYKEWVLKYQPSRKSIDCVKKF